MSTLIPDPLGSHVTHGEKELAKILRRLPEDWIVYYEPAVGGRKPDFVVLAPGLGLLVIEVKDWKLGTAKELNAERVTLESERPDASALKVQTISKGLQYRGVIVLWTDLLPSVRPEEAGDDRRMLYVAITRAETDLVLLGQPGV